MKKENVFVRVFPFGAMAMFFFGTPDVFASHKSIMTEHAVGQAEAEELLTFRIEEVVERLSPSRRAADPKIMHDERTLDPQLPAFNRGSNRAPLNPKGVHAI